MIRALGCPELPDPPICLRVGILHSRVVGIDVEMHLCSCFREAQHCGYFVCSLGGFLATAAGVNTKPTPVRGSGSPRLPGSFPRVRGNVSFVPPLMALTGSSPRVRGKPPLDEIGGAGARLIPARAGKTPPPTSPAPTCGAHPRACGENVERRLRLLEERGSSPRVRGKRGGVLPRRPGRGLIPARAGKTVGSGARVPVWGAHPRACGENRVAWEQTEWCRGSSPRVRGKPRRRPRKRVPPGLIPARAGKTHTVSC